MAIIESSIMIEKPVEEVWNFLTDLTNNGPKFQPGLIEMRQTSSGPVGVGTTFQSKRTNGTFLFRITEYEPNRRLTIEFTSGAISGSRYVSNLENMGGKTKLTLTAEPKLGGFYRLLGPFVIRNIKKENETALNNLKRILESTAPS